MTDEAVFDNLPKYDPTKFQPPAWASGPAFDFTRKNGETSKSATRTHSHDSAHSLDGNGDDSDEEEEIWEDAQDELVQQELEGGVEDSPDGLVFTVAELQVCNPSHQFSRDSG